VATIANEKPAKEAASADTAEERVMRLEGEKRFRTNCGRCHQAPHKFPPRVMAAAIRHMRVRATITDEDMRLILRYMTR
jgi:mono/diheme cytochrome c family protein